MFRKLVCFKLLSPTKVIQHFYLTLFGERERFQRAFVGGSGGFGGVLRGGCKQVLTALAVFDSLCGNP
jgi:hypothetical protein